MNAIKFRSETGRKYHVYTDYGEEIHEPLGMNGYCSMAEREDEYVTLHHEDIHFIDEDAERAFYESLAERKEE